MIGCPETSVRNYHRSLRSNPEEGRSQVMEGSAAVILASAITDTRHSCRGTAYGFRNAS